MKKDMNKLDKILIIATCLAVCFTIATMTIYTIKGWGFDTLITCFLGLFGGIEPVITGIIQISKYKHKIKDEKGDNDNELLDLV